MTETGIPLPIPRAMKEPPFVLQFDEASGVSSVRIQGFWNLDDVRDYINRVRQVVAVSRRRFGRAKMVVEMHDASVQSQEVMTAAAELNHLFGPSDKLAMVMSGSLVKMQILRVSTHQGIRFFSDRGTALTWIDEPV